MSEARLRSLFDEARELGISFAVLAGGEPLVRPEILDITQQHPEIISLMFTNGTLIDDAMLDRFQAQRNLVPVLSIEGYEEDTDGRRGQGVYEYLQTVIPKLQERDIFYAVSMTVTRSNYATVTGEPFVEKLVGPGLPVLCLPGIHADPRGDRGLGDHARAARRDLGQDERLPAKLSGALCGRAGRRGALWRLPGRRARLCAHQRGRRPGGVPLCALFRHQPARDVAPRGAAIRAAGDDPGERAALKRERGGCALWGKREAIEALIPRSGRG